MPALKPLTGRSRLDLGALLSGRPLVRLSASAERAWRLHQHGIAQRAADLDDLARRHVGLHAARQLTPWMTLHSRLPGTDPGVLRKALRSRQLLRVRCMRRTLHLVPTDLAPTVHTATMRQRIAPCQIAARRLELTGARGRRYERALLEALGEGSLAYDALQRVVGTRVGAKDAADVLRVRAAIKMAWEAGDLVVGDASDSLHHEQRTFALTASAVPGLQLTIDPALAVRTLLEHYLHAYGPVAMRDFAWWSGVALGDARPAWESLVDRLVRVRVDGIDDDLVALGDTVAELLDGDWSARPLPHVAVLAYEDPSLKGYFATRGRYVHDLHRDSLFNTIGEARASVLVDGSARAVWHWERESQTARVDILGRLTASSQRAVREAVENAVAFLRREPRRTGGRTPLAGTKEL